MNNTDNTNTNKSGLATASLVLGIIAVVMALGGFVPCLGLIAIWLAIPLALIGIALALFAPKKKVGLILGGVALLLAIMSWGFQAAVIEEAEEEFDRDMKELEREYKRSRRGF